MTFALYWCDTETTGLSMDNSIIEFSLLRYKDGAQRTWLIKADEELNTIQEDALRVNGHKLEDILHKTAYGKSSYVEPEQAISEIENWVAEDGVPSDRRILSGHNVSGFDKDRIINMWRKYDQIDTFPFSLRLSMDTLQIELFLAFCLEDYNKYYNLGSLVDKYKVKKLKAHRADADTIMVRDVFDQQVSKFKSLLK